MFYVPDPQTLELLASVLQRIALSASAPDDATGLHRLKLIERPMYGRGGFLFPRRRVPLFHPCATSTLLTSIKSAEDPFQVITPGRFWVFTGVYRRRKFSPSKNQTYKYPCINHLRKTRLGKSRDRATGAQRF
jgi:hypothetical protein